MVPLWLCRGGLSLERQISDYLLRQMMDIHWRSKHKTVLVKFLKKRNSIMKEKFLHYIIKISEITFTAKQHSGFSCRSWTETITWHDAVYSAFYGGHCRSTFLWEQYYHCYHYHYSRYLLTSFSGLSCSLLICVSTLHALWSLKTINLITPPPAITLSAITRYSLE